jgi:hypothetical protein
MNAPKRKRLRGEAFTGQGYGRDRYLLFQQARERIERALKENYPCEAVAIIESIITDRLESRMSFLTKTSVGFETLGALIHGLEKKEVDPILRSLIPELDGWRKRRNVAIHELVKVEVGSSRLSWAERILQLQGTANAGYELLKAVYTRVAELNPSHTDRVFGEPAVWPPSNSTLQPTPTRAT